MTNWNQPQCESCWIDDNTEEVEENGSFMLKIRQPVRMQDATVEVCSWCGELTIFGIYVRANPSDVPFPKGDE